MVRIDSEFKSLIPPLSDEERSGLEADIVRDGRATVPLVVWGGLLLDGHNRYEICQKHTLSYDTIKAPDWIKSRSDAKIWILQTSLNRRNLPTLTRIDLARQLEPLLAEQARERQAATRAKPGQGADLRDGKFTVPKNSSEPYHDPIAAQKEAERKGKDIRETRAQAAAAAGVSHPTYTAGKTILERGVPALKERVKSKGVSISTGADIATLPEPEQTKVAALSDKEILARAKKIRAQKTEVRRQERVEKLVSIATGNKPLDTVGVRYPVVYADPPWRYEHAESESRAIENQYPTMTLDEICALPLSTITTDDAILFMWATSPKLEEAMRVVRDWGFAYRTCAVWDKEKIGMGYYFRQAHELLLVATKGSPPTPPASARPSSVLRACRGEHSSKPDEMRELIERMYPELPKVEMFCRSPRNGWGVWGNQA
jgi:N6-adenosine-specific RNA methylase IME4